MPQNPFHNQIRQAIANPVLQAALDANAERRVQARATAFASLSEPLEVLRQRAHTVRAETVANLDHYLAKFIANAQANGITVHRATDAAEAVSITLDIVKKLPQKREERRGEQQNIRENLRPSATKIIAKSKTMVSEEIELNAALEAANIIPIETDLGEYIVQLRGEKPSHIITPAVHLRRDQVGETFHHRLGIPNTTDIPTLTNAARTALRETFLNADIGLSGVNFGVAESGALCIVTNEGNGRMVTTVPPVHIALMGMERLVPTFDDLALMLSLLPRSATGQKISVYTQIIHTPRRAGEADGALERHLIILDNGRAKLRGTMLNEALLCIRCGACLNACPVFREVGGHAYVGQRDEHTPYPGPIGSVISPGLFGTSTFGHLAQASTLCGACKDACPVDIDLPGMLLRVRSGTTAERPGVGLPPGVRLGLKVFTWAAARPRRFRLAQRLAAILGRILSPGCEQIRLPAFTGWGYSKDMARPATQTFRARFNASRGQTAGALKRQGSSTPNVGAVAQPTSISPVEQFERQLTALSGVFMACTPESLSDEILALLRERQIYEIMAWHDAHLPASLLDSLRGAGIRIEHTPQPKFQAGLTGALAAAAETGTLAIPSGAGRPQTASLFPQIHIAVLNESNIYKNLPQVLNLQEVREASTVALVSGPSRTADIEMTLTIGVHGPGEVHVFCVR